MWGKPGNPYTESDIAAYGTSHKWHLVDPDSIEYRNITLHWKQTVVSKPFGMYMCAGKKHSWIYTDYNGKERDNRTLMVLKETINLNGSGVCAYCKNYRLKELGLKEKVMG